jgi:predicted dehydrogenase
MAQAIRDGGTAEPDFGHAVRVHRLLDALRKSSDDRRTIGVGS